MPKVSDAHRQSRRDGILAAAGACFARDGFHRTTMADIVRESGISAGLVYRYFAGKDDVVAAIATQWHEQRAGLFEAGSDVFTLGASYLDLLRGLADPTRTAELRLGVQAWAEALRSPAVHAVTVSGVDGPRAAAATAIRSAQARGELPSTVDPDGLARVLIAIYQGLLLQTVWDPGVDHHGFVATVEQVLAALSDHPDPDPHAGPASASR